MNGLQTEVSHDGSLLGAAPLLDVYTYMDYMRTVLGSRVRWENQISAYT